MIIVLILSILGFANAAYLYFQHKREVETGQKMFCLIGGDCGAVVGSKYGKTFGVKNELTGMTYYALLAIYILISILFPGFEQDFSLFAKIATIIATIFSVYLLFVQTMVLKTLCSWCLIAIVINILIFYFLTFSPNSLTNFSILGSITNLQ